jgi:hypothetical protein
MQFKTQNNKISATYIYIYYIVHFIITARISYKLLQDISPGLQKEQRLSIKSYKRIKH